MMYRFKSHVPSKQPQAQKKRGTIDRFLFYHVDAMTIYLRYIAYSISLLDLSAFCSFSS